MDSQNKKIFPYKNPFKYGIFGPAIILLAFGQATGELIHWPYLIITYGLFFLFLLIPASLIQYPTFVFLARHTLLSGESHLLILSKINKLYGVLSWIIFIITSMWIASYTASGGIVFAKLCTVLTGNPVDLATFGKYSALIMNSIFFIILISLPKTYGFIKRLMGTVAVLSLVVISILFIITISNKGFDSSFFTAIFDIKFSMPSNWEDKDLKLLLTAIIFTGLGGLWNILYSVWLAQEGMGMSKISRSDYSAQCKNIPEVSESKESISNYTKSISLLKKDLWIGIFSNSVMILMITYIVYVSFPKDMQPPIGLGIITSLGDSVSYDSTIIASIFYIFVGLFLIDTWATAADSLSKLHSNMVIHLFKSTKYKSDEDRAKILYFMFLIFMLVMTFVSSFLARPEQLNYLNGVLSIFGAFILIIGILIIENYYVKKLPKFPKHKIVKFFLIVTLLIYFTIGAMYTLV